MLVCAVINVRNIQKDLPFAVEVDEEDWVIPAMEMARDHAWNPHWFGHPGSTVLYPLSLIARTQDVDTLNPRSIDVQTTRIVMLGRRIPLLFTLSSIPLLFAVARRLSRIVAFGSTVIVSFLPAIVERSTWIRDDTAGIFFVLLAILLLMRWQERQTAPRMIGIGIAIGLGLSTRYFLAWIMPFALCILWTNEKKRSYGNMLILILSTCIAFTLSSPFLILDMRQAVLDIAHEARAVHLGLDGFTPLRNMLWYLFDVLPAQMGPVLWLLGATGCGLAHLRKHRHAMFLTIFILCHLIVISAHPLHAAYWTLQILPLWACMGLWALWEGVPFVLKSFAGQSDHLLRLYAYASAVVIIAFPLWRESIHLSDQLQHPSTLIVARTWIENNVPSNSTIIGEYFTPPLGGLNMNVRSVSSIADDDALSMIDTGRYVLTSGWREGLYRREPERYKTQIERYEAVENTAQLVRTWEPDESTRGPWIRLYKVER